ncbi:MAG: AmmeMemoRadiSam system radical SAM enzyme [Prolixibacteraceae bacterium]|jgi:pyruvate formate lyase activating enzyme|nr:AmmeMemoRadiSam system radical SAM enzyme [Prolixibacteraceae bacterium]
MNKREFIQKGLSITGALACMPRAVMAGISGEKLWKWSREGDFWSPTPRGVKCLICPNECVIKEGEAGDCRNRVNHEGKLYTIAYGNPCAVHIDPIEKKPLNHFLPGSKAFSVATAGCNLACLNCQNWEISQKSPKETRNYDLMPDKLVAEAIANQCQSIAYTYSEPVTFYEYTFDSAKLAREEGIKNVMVTAGYINEEPLRNLCKYIDAANVDLKSFSNDIYLRLNAGALQPVLNTLKTMAAEGVWLEITNLVVPGWTDDMEMIKRMCCWLTENGLAGFPLHFSRFHPAYKLTQLQATPIGILARAREIALSEGMKFVYVGNVPGLGTQNTICPKCRAVAVERKGFAILKNNIEKGACKNCGEKISGRWEL